MQNMKGLVKVRPEKGAVLKTDLAIPSPGPDDCVLLVPESRRGRRAGGHV